MAERYGVNIIIFSDELFSTNKKRAYQFIDRLQKRNIRWFAQMRVTNLDQELLQKMRASGAYIASYGIESLSDKILASMKKKITRPDIETALKMTRDAKLGIQGNILFGDPAETEETIHESIKWWHEHPEYDLWLIMIMTLPNAPIYMQALETNLIKDELKYVKDGFPIINLTKLTDKRFKKLRLQLKYLNGKIKGKNHGKVIHSRRVPENGRTFYWVHIECPECKKITEYKLAFEPGIVVLLCRKCLLRYRVRSIEAFVDHYKKIELLMLRVKKLIYESRLGYPCVHIKDIIKEFCKHVGFNVV
jgi:radical SAM superfamily enzyme YgiQ (UPF0313 family)